MKAREDLLKDKNELKAYLTQVNRDWWFLKGQLIFAGILLAGLVFLMLWFRE